MWIVCHNKNKKYLTEFGKWTYNKEEAKVFTYNDAYEYLKKGYSIEHID